MFITTSCTTTRTDDHSVRTIYNYNNESGLDRRPDNEETVLFKQTDSEYLSNLNNPPFYVDRITHKACVEMPYIPSKISIGRSNPYVVSPRITSSYLPNMVGNRSRY
jgi:hypothetical protein